MVFDRFGFDKKLRITGVLSVIVVTILNYFAHTPLKFFVSLTGIMACAYAAKKLNSQFGVPLVFIRRGNLNYWGGAFGGLVGGLSGMYGATRNFEAVSFLDFGVNISILTIGITLATLLFMGTILQDVQDGYLEIKSD